jgi:hypothetical protein
VVTTEIAALPGIELVRFVLFSDGDLAVYQDALGVVAATYGAP